MPFTELKGTVRTDLSTDPYLRWILLLSFFMTGFYIWYLVPNFAAPDEFSRILRPMKVAGRSLVEGPSGFRAALLDGRALGALFYITAAVLSVVFVAIIVTGTLGDFTSLGTLTSRWDLWHATPEWFWTLTILLARVASVLIGIAVVYTLYRTATRMYSRRAGWFSATLLTVSLGVVSMTHEFSEDIPLLFVVTLAIAIAHRYAERGRRRDFWLGCVVAGAAFGLKFSGGICFVLLGTAHLYRWVASEQSFWNPRTLAYGGIFAICSIYLSFPNAVVGGPAIFVERLLNEFSRHIGGASSSPKQGPPFFAYNVLRAYLNGLGLPLFLTVCGGYLARLRVLATERTDALPELLVYPALAVFVGVFLASGEAQTHHLLPTYPMLLLPAGAALTRVSKTDAKVTPFILAVIIVVSSVYGVMGVANYASAPRDKGSDWIEMEQDTDTEMTVYENSIADVAAVHGRPLRHYRYEEEKATGPLVQNESDYTEWMLATSKSGSSYVQLTCSGAISYRLQPERSRYPERANYVKKLLSNRTDYRRVKTFGTDPERYLQRHRASPLVRLFYVGTDPNPTNVKECVVIFKKTDT